MILRCLFKTLELAVSYRTGSVFECAGQLFNLHGGSCLMPAKLPHQSRSSQLFPVHNPESSCGSVVGPISEALVPRQT